MRFHPVLWKKTVSATVSPHPRAAVFMSASGQKSSGGQRWDGWGSAGLTSSLQAWMRPFGGPHLASVHVFR